MNSRIRTSFWIHLVALTGGLLMGMQWSQAQWRLKGPFNRVSVELQTGIDFPLYPDPPSGNLPSYISTPNVRAGVRYMFSDMFGVRPVYGVHRFNGKNDGGGTLEIRRYGLDGIINLAEFLPAGNFRNPRKFNVLLYVGGSYGGEYANVGSEPERRGRVAMGTVGIAPQYRISRDFALTLDISGHASVSQSYGFDGLPTTSSNKWMPNAYFINGSVGVQFYIGSYAHHVDWK